MRNKLLVVFIVASLQLSAAERWQFLHYDKSSGFPFNMVNNVMQDSYGYLWIGGSTGLARFDGYSYEVYTAQDKNTALPSNRILCTFELPSGDILVGTNLGLIQYMRATNSFKLLIYNCTYNICADTNGLLWVATYDGLLVYDAVTLERKQLFKSLNDTLIKDFRGAVPDSHGRIWSFTASSGIYVFDAQTRGLVKHIDSEVISKINQSRLSAMAFDRNGTLWIGTEGSGLYSVDTAGFVVNKYISSSTDKSSIGSNNISHIYADKTGTVWISCQNGYLNRFDRKKNSFVRYMPQSDNSRFLNASSIMCVNEDRCGNLWIGTYGNGLYCKSALYSNFEVFIAPVGATPAATAKQVTAFAELDDRTIVVACDGSGLKIFNPADNSIRDFANNHLLASPNVLNIIKSGHLLWGATWGGGIFQIDLRTQSVTNFLHDVKNINGLNLNNIKGLYADTESLIVGTHGDGLALYDYKKNTFAHNKNSKDRAFDPRINSWVNHVTKDSKGTIWISTYYGLFSLSGQQLTHFETQTDDRKTISSMDVLSVLQDRHEQLWVLTTQGLDRYDYASRAFRRYGEQLALPTDTRSMVEDSAGNLWIGASDKLINYDMQRNGIHIFDKNDGIVSGELNINAAFKASDGTLYFGSTDGFMKCLPSKFSYSSEAPKLYFRSLSVNYVKQAPRSHYLTKMLELCDTLRYEYSEDVISIELSAILLGRNNKIDYSYTFDNDRGKWLNMGKDRIISFTALRPGMHILTVKATVEQGATAQKKLVIMVYPKWWMTWWFRALIALAAAAAIAGFVYLRMQKIRNINKQLEQLVGERTLELSLANRSLTGKSEELQQQALSLAWQNKSLEEKQIVIEMKNHQLRDVLDSKDRLIGIIAHDFRNPLSSILGIADLLRNKFDTFPPDKMKQAIETIHSSASSLTAQMNTVLDWAQSQMDDMVSHPVEINIQTIIEDAVLLVSANAAQKKIAVIQQFDYTHNALVDPRMMSTIVRNLLMNAIKFTTQGGSVTIVVQEIDQCIELSIIDTGVGMSKEMQDSLFSDTPTVSRYGTGHEKGIGLGLRVCKAFVLSNKGTIRVNSKVNEGSVFTVSVPAGQEIAVKSPHIETDLPIESLMFGSEPEIVPDKGCSVLIIEDDPAMLDMLRLMLDPYYSIFCANEGNSGLQMARNIVPSIIISDINMPNVNGIDLCRILKNDAMTNHIPIILITSQHSTHTHRESLISGAEGVIEKPFDRTVLLLKLSSLLENRKKLIQHLQALAPAETLALPASYDDELMKRTLDFIHEHYTNPDFDINLVSESVGVSRTQLWRKFKSTTGFNVSDYVLELRMRKAKEMLVAGKYKIAEIAYSVGFNTPQYFTKCFTQQFGTSPREYTEQHKKA